MVNVTAIIERASDGGFATYMLESFEKFGAHGFGNTAEEAKEDLFVAIEEFREMLGDDVPQMNIISSTISQVFLQSTETNLVFLGFKLSQA